MSESHVSCFFDKEKASKATEMLLEAMGHDGKHMPHWSEDQNLKETPERVAKYWEIVCNGYDEDPKRHLKLFDSDSKVAVMITNVPLYSFCSHHLALFRGRISIAYVPHGKQIGISKLLRIARVYAKRLQLQEDLTAQIADFLAENLSPDVAVDIRAEHTCMTIRGVRVPGSQTVTTAMRGKYLTDADLWTRFLNEAASNKGVNY
jgi:GTP cyclohydrolase IA